MRSFHTSAALVETWFDLMPQPSAETARALQAAVLGAESTLTRSVKWGNLVFSRDGNHLLALAAHKSHISLQVFNAAALGSAASLLQGGGRGTRQLKFRVGQPIDAERVAEIVRASVAAAPAQPRSTPPRGGPAREPSN